MEGLPTSSILLRATFWKNWWYFRSQDRRFVSSLRRGKSSPKAVHRPIQPGRCRPPPSAAPPSRGEQREHRRPHPPPSPEPSIIHLTPDRPLWRLPTGNICLPKVLSKNDKSVKCEHYNIEIAILGMWGWGDLIFCFMALWLKSFDEPLLNC